LTNHNPSGIRLHITHYKQQNPVVAAARCVPVKQAELEKRTAVVETIKKKKQAGLDDFNR
jgi:hypothetical protein